MSDKTKIEWADTTWNPITGCEPISEGCENCYAKRMAKRLAGRFGYPKDNPFQPGVFHADKLGQPLHWKKPRRIFVCSMSDLFHEEGMAQDVFGVLSIISRCPQHTFLILTKRPENIPFFCEFTGIHFPKNLWLGVTAENQKTADERIPELLRIPAPVRFVSVEPMLEKMNIEDYLWSEYDKASMSNQMTSNMEGLRKDKLDWVICGAETGPGKRPMNDSWAWDLFLQCQNADVPFFFKKDSGGNHELNGKICEEYPESEERKNV